MVKVGDLTVMRSSSYNKPKKDYYLGTYKGQVIAVDKAFRDYTLSEDECAALCTGEHIEVHNLRRGPSLYGVVGKLSRDMFNETDAVGRPIYAMTCVEARANNPDYNFYNRDVLNIVVEEDDDEDLEFTQQVNEKPVLIDLATERVVDEILSEIEYDDDDFVMDDDDEEDEDE